MFGSHLSIAGGLHNALVEAKSLDMDCVQIFTKNQRQWAAPPLTDKAIRLWREHRKSTGIRIVVSHDSYLINLASPKDDVREKSIALFRDELERCEILDIPFLVTHPGAHLGIGEDAGLQRVAQALDTIHQLLPGAGIKTITCLEITAGQGTSLGWRLEHLRTIIDRVKQPERLAVCIDTAHAFAAGYDPASQEFLDELDATIGCDRVKVLHVNDSKVERGKRVDRHAHIGQGHIPLETFAVICNTFRGQPKILETPKEQTPEGIPWDAVNLQTLRKLMR
ncbi:MAG: deoxyribonuclease IV [Phycisphaerales bacterium]